MQCCNTDFQWRSLLCVLWKSGKQRTRRSLLNISIAMQVFENQCCSDSMLWFHLSKSAQISLEMLPRSNSSEKIARLAVQPSLQNSPELLLSFWLKKCLHSTYSRVTVSDIISSRTYFRVGVGIDFWLNFKFSYAWYVQYYVRYEFANFDSHFLVSMRLPNRPFLTTVEQ